MGLYFYGKNPRAILSRLFLQPAHDIKDTIFQVLEKNDFAQCVGLQLRMGGNVSNTIEYKSFLSQQSIRNIIQQIDVLERDHFKLLFLTTDASNLTQKELKQINMTIIESNAFSVCHSSIHFRNSNYSSCLKRAVVDSILISHCDHMYVTYGSSYGRLCSWLSYNSKNRIINNTGIM